MNKLHEYFFSSEYDIIETNSITHEALLVFVAGHDKPVLRYNPALVMMSVIKKYGAENITESNADDLIVEHVNEIIEEIKAHIAMLRNNNNEWGTHAALQENVHDHSVNISFRNGYAKLIEENNKTPDTYKVCNIITYFNEHKTNLMCELSKYMNAVKFAQSLIEFLEQNNDLNNEQKKTAIEQITAYKNIFNEAMPRLSPDGIPRQYAELSIITRHINYIAQQKEFMISINDNETNVLLNVWKRIHAKCNEHNRENLLHNLAIELKNIRNPARPDEIECVNGRIGALLSVLDIDDAENIIEIKSVPVIRIYMQQHRAPFYINKAIEIAKNMYGNLYEEYITLNNDDEVPKHLRKVREMIVHYVSTKLEEEFGGQLSKETFADYLQQILREI